MRGRLRAILAGLLVAVAGASGAAAAELRVMPAAAATGFFGLEIEVGSSCVSADEVVLSAPPATVSGVIEACRQIEAAGVELTGETTLRAGEVITLSEGLRVAAGADVTLANDSTLASEFVSVADPSPIAELTYRARFQLLLDDLALSAGEEIEHFRGEAADGSALFRLLIRPDLASPGHLVALAALESGGWRETPAGEEVVLPQGWNAIELDWVAGAGGGHWLVSVNDGVFEGLTGLASDGAVIDRVRWGAIDGTIGDAPGLLRVDGFSSWR